VVPPRRIEQARQRHVERGRQPLQQHRRGAALAALDQRDHRAAHPAALRQRIQGETASGAQVANPRGDPLVEAMPRAVYHDGIYSIRLDQKSSRPCGCYNSGIMNRQAVLYALASAALFGLSTPAAKLLVGSVHPVVLAGLLYCGAGGGGALLRRVLPARGLGAPEARLTRAELPWLAGAIAAGGVLGPVLLMVGLLRTDAAGASLLLTLEGAATALMAWFVFHENFDRRIALGMGCLISGAVVLSWTGNPSLDTITGPLAIVGACLAWGLDNNLTRKVSLADPLQIVQLKGLIAGPFNLLL